MNRNTLFAKIISALLCFLLLFSLLTGCKDRPNEEDPKPEGKTDETPNEDEGPADDPVDDPADDTPKCPEGELPLVWENASNYQIVRARTVSHDLQSAIVEMRTALEKATGVRLPFVADEESSLEKATEIVIGESARSGAAELRANLSEEGYVIAAIGEKIYVEGATETCLLAAIRYFTNRLLKSAAAGRFTLPETLNVSRTMADERLEGEASGSALKKQYSDYIATYRETLLLSFDTADFPGVTFANCDFSVDRECQREGEGALRLTYTEDYTGTLCRSIWQGTGTNSEAFHCSVTDRRKTTLKLWIYVEDTDEIPSDHDAQYGRQENQATFFFRVMDSAGRAYNWNHTLTENGWHEVELSFNVHNGISEGFDYENIVSFGLMNFAKQGTFIELDDLRLVEYETDFEPSTAPEGGRWITSGEYDALDGAIVQEWYGASYDTEDKTEGKSSLHYTGNDTVNDFRLVVANTDLQMNYENDVLVVYMKIKKFSAVETLFIELNEEQDKHEYSRYYTVNELKQRGLTAEDTWCRVELPISEFQKQLDASHPSGENIVLHNFRFCITAAAGKTFDAHVDLVYLTTKENLSKTE